MTVARPFLAHQFALLHLLGVLALCRTDVDAEEDGLDLQEPAARKLVLPQELMMNALCYLTEQIHEVAPPHVRLSQLVDDLAHLAYSYTDPDAPDTSPHATTPAPAPAKPARRPSNRGSSSKRVSTSPSTVTRSLRNRRSSLLSVEASNPLLPPAQPQAGPSGSSSLHNTSSATASPAQELAAKLKSAVELDIGTIKEDGFDALMASMGEYKVLLGELDDPHSNSFLDRSSPLARWLRRCILSLNLMTFTEVEALIRDLVLYTSLEPISPHSSVKALFPVEAGTHAAKNSLSNRVDSYEAYISAIHRNDYSASFSEAAKFFDYDLGPFWGGPTNNKGLRQHALLNLAALHTTFEEWSAARTAADEGLQVARQAGDLTALNALTSIMRRINFESPSVLLGSGTGFDSQENGASAYDQGREDPGGFVPPQDHLWDIRYGLSSRIPLTALSYDLFRAKALYHTSLTTRTNMSAKERKKEKKLALQQGREVGPIETQLRKLKWNRLDAIAWSESSALLWDTLGSKQVAASHRMMASIASGPKAKNATTVDIDPAAGNRIAVISGRAKDLAQNGAYDAALALLLAEALPGQSQMTVSDVKTWQNAIYDVLRTKAKRHEYDHVISLIDNMSPGTVTATAFPSLSRVEAAADSPSVLAGPRYEAAQQTGIIGDVESKLKRSRKLLDTSQAALALPLAFGAYYQSSLSDGQGLLALHRKAAIQLARVHSQLRAGDRALRTLDEVMPDILSCGDAEVLADALRVKAECRLALIRQVEEDSQPVEAQEKIFIQRKLAEDLKKASTIYKDLGCVQQHVETLAVLAKALHSQGETAQRDSVATEWREAHNARSQAKDGEQTMLYQLAELQSVMAEVSGQAALLHTL